jgi:hypothetical protein
MEQAATVRELCAVAQRVTNVESYGRRLDTVEQAVRDINKIGIKILLAICAYTIALIVLIVLYAQGLIPHHG